MVLQAHKIIDFMVEDDEFKDLTSAEWVCILGHAIFLVGVHKTQEQQEKAREYGNKDGRGESSPL